MDLLYGLKHRFSTGIGFWIIGPEYTLRWQQ